MQRRSVTDAERRLLVRERVDELERVTGGVAREHDAAFTGLVRDGPYPAPAAPSLT